MDVSLKEVLRNRNEYKQEMILYLLFIEEKTQKQAAEFMYQKEYSNINTSTIKEARKTLTSSNLVESDGSLRNAKFKSNTDVIAEIIRDSANESNQELTDEDFKGLKMLLNSQWFRSFFSLEHIEGLKGIARNTNGTLEVSSGFNGLEEVLVVFDDINQMAELGEQHSYSKIAEYNSFEDYLESQKGLNLPIDPEEVKKIFLDTTAEKDEELDWRKNFLDSLIIDKEIFTSLPYIPVVVEHRNSDILLGKNRYKDEIKD